MPTMKKIDIRSLLIGILATALIMVTVGAASITAVPMAEIGRYQLLEKGSVLTIFDTTTGDYYENDPKESWRKTIDIE